MAIENPIAVAIAVILAVVLIPPSLGAVATYVLMRRWAGKTKVCRQCRQAAPRINDVHCQSCGSDLRVVGLVSADHRWRLIASLAVAVWLFPLPLVVQIASTTLMHVLPRQVASESHWTMSRPFSEAYTEVHLTGIVETQAGWFGRSEETVRSEWAATFFRDSEESLVVTADHLGGTVSVWMGQEHVNHDGPVRVSQLAEWLRYVFHYADEADGSQFEAEEILMMAEDWMARDYDSWAFRSLAKGASGQFGPFRSYGPASIDAISTRSEHPSLIWLVIVGTVVIWLGATILIIYVARRCLLRRLRASGVR